MRPNYSDKWVLREKKTFLPQDEAKWVCTEWNNNFIVENYSEMKVWKQ
jgi:hypothetical protein